MTVDELLRASPFLFHATRTTNLSGICARGKLLSPSEAYRLHGLRPPHMLRRSKGGSVKHIVPLADVYLSDHDRLHEKNIRFEHGWDMPRLIEHLDGLVFFWPGDEGGRPSKQGIDHLGRYNREGRPSVVLRVPTEALVAANGPPQFSSCNSGAPRQHPTSGKQPRGPSTFRPLEAFAADDEIVEIVFEREVELPQSTERAPSYEGPWEPLF